MASFSLHLAPRAAQLAMSYPRGHLLILVLRACYLVLLPLSAAALSFDYSQNNLGSADLKYMGDSYRVGDIIILTNMTGDRTGRVAYGQPVRLWDGSKRASFNTTFSFAINGNINHRGDGMAFFIGPFPGSVPPASEGGCLGLISLNSRTNTVGVEFDTYHNDWDPPYTVDHVGIDVNSIISSNSTKVPNGGLFGTMSASITYNADSKVLAVSLLANGTIHTVQWGVDFKDAGVPQDAAIGFSAATAAYVESNELLSWSFSSTDIPETTKLWVKLALSVGSPVFAGLLGALLYWVIVCRRPRRPEIDLPVVRKYSYQELSVATNNFSKETELRAGTFGVVHRGDLRDPRMPPVAVKKITLVLKRTRRDYVAEIKTLGQLSHRNLVKLVGWCDGGSGNGDDSKLLLVYELVTNASLDEHLHDLERLLAWPKRYTIICDIGAAIEYLHTGYKKCILHRDIKPGNVMLDDDYVAKLGDFGLVREVGPGDGSLQGTTMIGSYGYMDPQCITTDTVSIASDVYSFGVLLLEVATGKKPTLLPVAGGFQTNALIGAVRESYGKGDILEVADGRLNGDFDRKQMERVLLIGLLCVRLDRQERPGIRRAVNLLSDLTIPVPLSDELLV